MNIYNFTTLLTNLLSCDVYLINDLKKDLGFLTGKINPNNLFFEFSFDYLLSFIMDMKTNTFYEFINVLGERIFLFKIDNFTIVIGPYLKRSIDDGEISRRMLNNNLPSQLFNLLKSQYLECAILDSYNIRKVVTSCLIAYTGNDLIFYDFEKINHFEQSSLVQVTNNANDVLYEQIYKKYEYESDLLYKIEHGLVEDLKSSSQQIANSQTNDYIQYYMLHPNEAMASLRAMVKTAAVRSGLSVIIIDEIMSKYTFLMRNSSSLKESQNLIESFEIEMAKAVRDYLNHVPNCSPFLKKIVEYIIVNYAENITLNSLSERFKISTTYLSHMFKKEINKGVKEFIEEIRIMNACRFFENTDMNISQVGAAVGYFDNNYFTKVFKKQIGITPREYKTKLNNS